MNSLAEIPETLITTANVEKQKYQTNSFPAISAKICVSKTITTAVKQSTKILVKIPSLSCLHNPGSNRVNNSSTGIYIQQKYFQYPFLWVFQK